MEPATSVGLATVGRLAKSTSVKSKLPVVDSLPAARVPREASSSATEPLKLASTVCAWVISGASFVPVTVTTNCRVPMTEVPSVTVRV